MKKWVENKEPSGAVVHTLVFGHHGDDPKVIVELFRDSEGDWLTISNVLDTDWDLLTGKEMCEHDAKMMVEEMPICFRTHRYPKWFLILLDRAVKELRTQRQGQMKP